MKKPFVSIEKLKEIIKEHPTPFHIYDERGIRENARKLMDAFSWNKGFKEYFAVKATPNPSILRILKEEGCGVDCATYTELMLAQAEGFSGEDIMFSSNVTPKEDYILSRNLNAIINFDDITDIDYLDKISSIPETICCRYNPGGVFGFDNDIMDTPQDAKYGFTRQQLAEGFKRLIDKGVKSFGLHSLLVSNSILNEYYPILARLLFKTAVELTQETGAQIDFINLSGGIGIPYYPEQQAIDIYAVGQGVKKEFEQILVPAGMENVKIFAELGRFMLGPYGHLVATVIREKHIYKDYIGLDACAANLMRPAIYGAYHHITVMGKENEPHEYKYDVVGGLCENNDKFAVDRMLPKVDIGDLIVIHDTGAHGFSMGYNYNGKLRSAEILLREDGGAELIRRAETASDYFSTLDIDDKFINNLEL